jgi:hypothetical protein
MPRPARGTPAKETIFCIRAGWDPAAFWTGVENHPFTGVRTTTNCPARSESLYHYTVTAHFMCLLPCEISGSIQGETFFSWPELLLTWQEGLCPMTSAGDHLKGSKLWVLTQIIQNHNSVCCFDCLNAENHLTQRSSNSQNLRKISNKFEFLKNTNNLKSKPK